MLVWTIGDIDIGSDSKYVCQGYERVYHHTTGVLKNAGLWTELKDALRVKEGRVRISKAKESTKTTKGT